MSVLIVAAYRGLWVLSGIQTRAQGLSEAFLSGVLPCYDADQDKEEYNTSAPFYSRTLAEQYNARAPYKQYYIYLFSAAVLGTSLSKTLNGWRSLLRAKELGTAAFLKAQKAPTQEVLDHLALADGTFLQLRKAEHFIRQHQNRARVSFAVAIASPLLWIAYLQSRSLGSSTQQPRQSIRKT